MYSHKLPLRLRAKDIAKFYGIGLSTVWLYAKQGKLIPIKVSDKVTMFDSDEVEKFFSNNSQSKIKESK